MFFGEKLKLREPVLYSWKENNTQYQMPELGEIITMVEQLKDSKYYESYKSLELRGSESSVINIVYSELRDTFMIKYKEHDKIKEIHKESVEDTIIFIQRYFNI